MSIQILQTGHEKTPVIVIDDVVPDPQRLVDHAASLAPFPAAEGHYYPGVRRYMGPDDAVGFAYASAVCQTLAPLMNSIFAVPRFVVQDASFSLVTTPPEELSPLQCLPHIDCPEFNSFAVIHYLSHHRNSGTAFYRHASTGFETITYDRLGPFTFAREQEEKAMGRAHGYMGGSSHGFEEIARVESRFNRLAVYPSALFHSGIVPDDHDFSADPRSGRLTGNIFLNRAAA